MESERGEIEGAASPTAEDSAGQTFENAPADEELADIARSARAEGRPSPPAGKQPRSLMILAVVIFCVLGMGVYGIIYARKLMDKTSEARWKTLEQRLVNFEAQELFKKQHDYAPAGKDVSDLSPAEHADLEAMRSRYGTRNLQPAARSDGGKLVLMRLPDGTVLSTQPSPTTSP